VIESLLESEILSVKGTDRVSATEESASEVNVSEISLSMTIVVETFCGHPMTY
jgi:hypothetical protein